MKKQVEEYHDYILHDVMGDIPNVTSRKMFGGFGLYQKGIIFAIITDENELYFKVDDMLKKQYKAHGSHPFVYTGHKNKGPVEMSYWLLPEEIMEDREKLSEWIAQSVAVSRSRAKK